MVGIKNGFNFGMELFPSRFAMWNQYNFKYARISIEILRSGTADANRTDYPNGST